MLIGRCSSQKKLKKPSIKNTFGKLSNRTLIPHIIAQLNYC